jgi:ketosteroid isomerase-like protein
MKRPFLLFLLALFFLQACQISEEEKIRQIINRREEAFQKKNISLYLSCISKAYQDQDKDEDLSRLQSRIEGYFKTFDRIEYASWDRSIHIEGDQAMVAQQFYIEVEKDGKKNRYSGKEALFLKKEGREWKIIKSL